MSKSAKYWKDRADKVRAIAECMQDEETKGQMAAIADDYDRYYGGQAAKCCACTIGAVETSDKILWGRQRGCGTISVVMESNRWSCSHA